MNLLSTRSAVVTGASQGIGRSIAKALAAEGVDTVLASRSLQKLESVRDEIGESNGRVRCIPVNLANSESIDDFARTIHSEIPELSILVNCGGIYERGDLNNTSTEPLDRMFKINVQGAYELSMSLMPLLKSARGDLVFINSTIVFSAGNGAGQFAATQHALRSITNTIREEVNNDGVRVLTVYPGRTATPRQESICEQEGKDYAPGKLLQSADIAQMVLACLSLPETAEVIDLHIRPRLK